MCNTYSFPTGLVVARTRLYVTLYINFLPCFFTVPYNFRNVGPNFMFKPCIDMTSLNNNQLMHSQYNIYEKHIKSSCNFFFHVKFTPTCFGTQMEPSSGGQHLILAKVYIWFNGASPYSQYCGGIGKPMCVYCQLYGRRLCF